MEEKTELEIYSHKKDIYIKELKRLKKANISSRNKELITQFHDYVFSTGSGEQRVSKLSAQLRSLCRWLKEKGLTQDLDKVSKKDLASLLSFLHLMPEKSINTKADYRRCIKQFFKWFKQEDLRLYGDNAEERRITRQFYDFVEHDVKRGYKQPQIDPKDVIQDQDIDLIVENGAETPRDKALIICLHEWGTRPSEFLRMKIGNIIFKEDYAEVHVPHGKTGKRVIYSIRSVPYLLKYLDVHPYKNNPQAFLWVSNAQFNNGEPLLHKGGQKIIDRCFKKAGVSKRRCYKWFRHSRASLLAPKMTQSLLCKFMGWSLDSEMIKTYCHLCNEQLEDAFLRLNKVKKEQEDAQKPIKCVCKALNNYKERYCYKCFRPLNVEVMVQDQELVKSESGKAAQFLMDIMDNPVLLKKFQEFKKNMQ